MEPFETTNNATFAKDARSTDRILLGVLFLLPSMFCCIFQLLVPTINTFWMSLHNIKPIGSEKEFIGLENYVRLFGDGGFSSAVGFTVIIIMVRLLVVAVVPLLLAWAASHFGRPVHLGLRTLLILPVVLFVPIAIAITWGVILNPSAGLLPSGISPLADPSSARVVFLFIDALYLFGLVSGLGLIVCLPIWRRPAGAPPLDIGKTVKPMLVVWVIGILAVIVFTLSTFTLSYVLTDGGPLGCTSTLATLFYKFAFLNFSFGLAASVASVILLVTLGLGVAAGLLVVLARLRLNIINALPGSTEAASQTDSMHSSVFPGILLVVLLLPTLGGCLFSVLPFGWLILQSFGMDGIGLLLEQISAIRVFANTFVPQFITATLQMLIAYPAALSIGALRPLGKRSEWLLLLFSPWLFITTLPLGLDSFLTAQKLGMLDTVFGLISPILLSVPVLFVLTVFFEGRTSQLHRIAAETEQPQIDNLFKHFVLPSLPLAVVLWLFLLFAGWQDLFWSLLVGVRPEVYPLSINLLQLKGMTSATGGTLAAAVSLFVLPVCFFFFVSLALFQIFYLDRLVLYTDDLSSPDPVTQDSHIFT